MYLGYGKGNFRLNAGSGDINLVGLSGTFDCNTGSGELEGKNVTLGGPGKFNSGSGDAIVALSGQLNHSIDVASGSGDAKLRFNGTPIGGQVIMKPINTMEKLLLPLILPVKKRSKTTTHRPAFARQPGSAARTSR